MQVLAGSTLEIRGSWVEGGIVVHHGGVLVADRCWFGMSTVEGAPSRKGGIQVQAGGRAMVDSCSFEDIDGAGQPLSFRSIP